MSLLARYLLRRVAGPLLPGTALLCAVIWALQLLRLGHHLGGGEGLGRLIGQLLLLSLPTLLSLVLPLALAGAVLFGLGRLAETRQLLAMQLGGAAPTQIAAPVLALALAVAAATAAAARLEPRALSRLEQVALRRASLALLGSLEPRQFRRLSRDATIYVDRRLGRRPLRLGGLLLARQDGHQLLLAREATIRPAAGAQLDLDLVDAEWQQRRADGSLLRVRAGRYHERLDLSPELRPVFGFLGQRARRPGRALNAAAACPTLALLAVLIALRTASRLKAAALGVGSAAAYLAASEAAASWVAGGGLALAGLAALASWLALARAR